MKRALVAMRRSTRACAIALLSVAALVTAGACRPGADHAAEVVVDWSIEPSPPAEGPVRVRFRLEDDAGRPEAGAAVEVEAGMNHAGMVPELAQAADLEQGQYAADLELTMGGDWFLVFRGELRDGRSFEQVAALPGVAPR